MVVQIDRPLPIKPARGYLVCELIKEQFTSGGLALPENIGEDSYRPKKLRVLAVGADKIHAQTGQTIPTQSKVGDIVIPGGPGFCWDFNGTTLWIVDADMIVCKVVSDA